MPRKHLYCEQGADYAIVKTEDDQHTCKNFEEGYRVFNAGDGKLVVPMGDDDNAQDKEGGAK